MTELLTSAQMRGIEGAAIESGHSSGLDLMERAGREVVAAILDEWPDLRGVGQEAVILCGPGNNGGDGFVIARLLSVCGWHVEVVFYGDAAQLPPDAGVNLQRWLAMAGAVSRVDRQTGNVAPPLQHQKPHIIVDALFGTGLSRPLPSALQSLLGAFGDQVGAGGSKFVAVDIVSGLCANSGRAIGCTPPRADLTVTFHRAKLGHFLDQGPHHTGRLRVVDIGLPIGRPTTGEVVRTACAPQQVAVKQVDGHKFDHGHALVLAGGIVTGGAARLSARGALRVGAGLVTLGCPPSAVMVNAAQLNAIMLRPVREAASLAALLADSRINALCIGPGFGTGPREAGLLAAALEQSGDNRPIVLDADALTLLSRDAALFGLLDKDCILTPHAGEFRRLFPDLAERLAAPATQGPAYSKMDATVEAAKRAGCVVLFKGAVTIIADPAGRCCINAAVYDRLAPWLATAGSGDVLAGFITGLLARGQEPFDAATTGAWLHVEAARSFGAGLIAEDLPEELPKLFHALTSAGALGVSGK
jgi:ADP-dependent NAD(P)H-hydrate dehydratase / NAD(P)H-hydrate epimerase